MNKMNRFASQNTRLKSLKKIAGRRIGVFLIGNDDIPVCIQNIEAGMRGRFYLVDTVLQDAERIENHARTDPPLLMGIFSNLSLIHI